MATLTDLVVTVGIVSVLITSALAVTANKRVQRWSPRIETRTYRRRARLAPADEADVEIFFHEGSAAFQFMGRQDACYC
jgi:hypothetical protein